MSKYKLTSTSRFTETLTRNQIGKHAKHKGKRYNYNLLTACHDIQHCTEYMEYMEESSNAACIRKNSLTLDPRSRAQFIKPLILNLLSVCLTCNVVSRGIV